MLRSSHTPSRRPRGRMHQGAPGIVPMLALRYRPQPRLLTFIQQIIATST